MSTPIGREGFSDLLHRRLNFRYQWPARFCLTISGRAVRRLGDMAILTVEINADSGSLRQASVDVQAEDTIAFDPTFFSNAPNDDNALASAFYHQSWR